MATMQFSGRRLQLVRLGLYYALGEVHNQIATCPDPDRYSDEIEGLEAEHKEIEQLIAEMDRKHPTLAAEAGLVSAETTP